ncbi:MAG: cellulose biosynthesis protein BcsN [Siculibacillus sp.]|nr:cellulose biosynthesis protein BcsN [Siculibacillus sp.]
MRSTGPLFALAVITPLAACADLGESRALAPFATGTVPASLATEVGPDQALARLPAEAGAVVSVTERRETDRITQVVALAGEAIGRGTNRIRVVAANRDPERSRRPTEEAITAELEAELPEATMRPVAQVISGPGGPIGVAAGRTASGETCVYAWQEAEVRASGARAGIFGGDRVDLSVRVRLCRRDMTEERAIALVEGLRLRGDVVTLGGASPAGRTGVDALASAGYAAAPSRAADFAPARVSPPPAPRVVSRGPKPTVASRPIATAAAVPLPAAAGKPATAPAPVIGPAPSGAVPAIPLPTGG